MKTEEQINRSLHLLLDYIEKKKFKGYDPYDGLLSPVFRFPLLRNQHKLRFIAQQAVKRSPINLRPLLGIKPGLNPVTLGLCIQAYASMYGAQALPEYKEKVIALIESLVKLIPEHYATACWGYDFPWEARYATIPAYQPTVVATGIISNSLYIAYNTFQLEKAGELVISSCDFITNHLNKAEDTDGTFCFSYSPFDNEKVFNASMKGSRLLAQGYKLTQNKEWKILAAKSVNWVMKYQTNDGSWIYSQRESGKWVDNYHTAYILDCLDEYMQCTGDDQYKGALLKGVDYYLKNFITASGQAKFYNEEIWPADCTAAGQTLLTLSRFGYKEEANRVALWMIQNMQADDGHFFFRKYKNHIEKTSFMRWSDSWMLAGMAAVKEKFHTSKQPL